MNALIQKAIQLRQSGDWIKHVAWSAGKPSLRFKKYHPGDIVWVKNGKRYSRYPYVYVGSFRTNHSYGSGMGMYLLLNRKGKCVKHANIRLDSEIQQ